jgi:hypothetical protein
MKKLLEFCLDISLLEIDYDGMYGGAGYPWFLSISILQINNRSLIHWDNWGTLDLAWFAIRR